MGCGLEVVGQEVADSEGARESRARSRCQEVMSRELDGPAPPAWPTPQGRAACMQGRGSPPISALCAQSQNTSLELPAGPA